MYLQIVRLRPHPDVPEHYKATILYGDELSADRGNLEAGGAILPTGVNIFALPVGSVVLGDVLLFAEQYFQVTGLIPESIRIDHAVSEQRPGSYPVAA